MDHAAAQGPLAQLSATITLGGDSKVRNPRRPVPRLMPLTTSQPPGLSARHASESSKSTVGGVPGCPGRRRQTGLPSQQARQPVAAGAADIGPAVSQTLRHRTPTLLWNPVRTGGGALQRWPRVFASSASRAKRELTPRATPVSTTRSAASRARSARCTVRAECRRRAPAGSPVALARARQDVPRALARGVCAEADDPPLPVGPRRNPRSAPARSAVAQRAAARARTSPEDATRAAMPPGPSSVHPRGGLYRAIVRQPCPRCPTGCSRVSRCSRTTGNRVGGTTPRLRHETLLRSGFGGRGRGAPYDSTSAFRARGADSGRRSGSRRPPVQPACTTRPRKRLDAGGRADRIQSGGGGDYR